jgi:amidase
MGEELARLDATAQAELIGSGQASPAELVEAAIRRVEAVNPELNAVIHPLFEKGMETAAGDLPEGPFRGVPMLVKDLLCHTAGDPFHEGMAFLKERGWVEKEDQALARRFREAGFVFVGKTNTPELGIPPTTEPHAYGPTKNPWDTSRSPGGSSGGSAAAVASGMVPLAHANDGGGSIRIPASACGLVGLKPSRARVSLGPEFGDLSSGLVHEHVVCRSVRDCAAVLDAIQGGEPGDPYAAPTPERPYVEEVGADPGRLRVGAMLKAPGGQFEVQPECVQAAEETAQLLESLGDVVIEPSYPPALDDPEYIGHFLVRWSAGVAFNLAYWSRRTGDEIGPDDVEPMTWSLAEMGRAHDASGYLAAMEHQQQVSRRAAEWWAGGFDLLVTPTMGERPTLLGEFKPSPDDPTGGLMRGVPTAGFTAIWNVTGQPAISLPLHWSDQGLPIGVQLIAAYGREDLLIRVASQLEEVQPWTDRTPPVFAA